MGLYYTTFIFFLQLEISSCIQIFYDIKSCKTGRLHLIAYKTISQEWQQRWERALQARQVFNSAQPYNLEN